MKLVRAPIIASTNVFTISPAWTEAKTLKSVPPIVPNKVLLCEWLFVSIVEFKSVKSMNQIKSAVTHFVQQFD